MGTRFGHRPWTDERRAQASAAAKARVAEGQSITARDFIGDIKRQSATIQTASDNLMSALCAAEYMKLRFPHFAAEIEEAYKPAARLLNWE